MKVAREKISWYDCAPDVCVFFLVLAIRRTFEISLNDVSNFGYTLWMKSSSVCLNTRPSYQLSLWINKRLYYKLVELISIVFGEKKQVNSFDVLLKFENSLSLTVQDTWQSLISQWSVFYEQLLNWHEHVREICESTIFSTLSVECSNSHLVRIDLNFVDLFQRVPQSLFSNTSFMFTNSDCSYVKFQTRQFYFTIFLTVRVS